MNFPKSHINRVHAHIKHTLYNGGIVYICTMMRDVFELMIRFEKGGNVKYNECVCKVHTHTHTRTPITNYV